MKVVTYATHSEGSFDEIVKNSFGIEVVVLGWGTKWNGFMDKFNAMLKYLNDLDDNELVVFVDGFDSYIVRSLDGLQETFESLECDMLISKDVSSGNYFSRRQYTTCKNNIIANTGLYMGYAGIIRDILSASINTQSNDDQRAINLVCKKFDRLKIDTDCIIFENQPNDFKLATNPYFIQKLVSTRERWIRRIQEWAPTFIPEAILLLLVLYFLYLHYIKK